MAKKQRVDHDKEHVIVVVAPRIQYEHSYNPVLAGVIKVLDQLEAKEKKQGFVFLHDGVSSGSLSYVLQVVNNLNALMPDNRYLSLRKLDLDIEFYGKESQNKWLEQTLEYDPDYFLILDDNDYFTSILAKEIADLRKIERLVIRFEKRYAKERK